MFDESRRFIENRLNRDGRRLRYNAAQSREWPSLPQSNGDMHV
ncbi:hypothetical protein TRICHSKD4_0271 [Roseibium sp. TrichSKD4]|nr:hypothetical protein TRICHSKD4_0271 [Roseibium sp. TrichSKD4]